MEVYVYISVRKEYILWPIQNTFAVKLCFSESNSIIDPNMTCVQHT
jgi:hypothetical protein